MASSWNVLMERVASAGLSQREAQVVAAVARRTLGWRKTWDRISASQVAADTGISRRHISFLLPELERRQVLIRSEGVAGRAARLALNLEGPWLAVEPAPAEGQVVPLKPARVRGQVGTEPAREQGQVRKKPPAPVEGHEPAPAEGHTRGKGVKATGSKAATQAAVGDAIDAYRSTGGNIDGRSRGALARSVKALLAAGFHSATITAAAMELGRDGEFPAQSYLREKADEIRDAGGPCYWGKGCERAELTVAQLRKCTCTLCGEWAEAKEAEAGALTGAQAAS
jgi:phage replication O-like protein O